MIGEEIASLNLRVVHEMPLSNGERVVLAGPINHKWPLSQAINHNVFRLDRFGEVIWQVHREEIVFADWGKKNATPKLIEPSFSEDDCDPFASMGTQFFIRRPFIDNQPYLPKFNHEFFDSYAPGRLLSLSTYELEYDLDPETGIAVCTGVPVN